MYFYDYWGLVFLIPALLLGLITQIRLKSVYSKFSKMNSATGLTGYTAARRILDEAGLNHVPIECIPGNLTDHFDPKANVLRLSESVYNGPSVAAVGVAAHECGHAIQYSKDYAPMKLRGALVKTTNFSSNFSFLIVILGIILSLPPLAYVGVGLFGVVVLFQLVTLPVEFDASGRALKILGGMLPQDECRGARKVLSAAAMTYVAALVTSLLQLLRLIMIVRGNRK